MKLSVIIPAYNEDSVIKDTLTEVIAYLDSNYANDYELIVVNDGSTDKTADIVREFGDGVRLIELMPNKGKGSAVKAGVARSQGDWILFMDADNSTNIKELDKFRQYQTDYQVIIGSRAVAGANIQIAQPWFKSSLGRLGNLLIQLLLLPGIKDSRCGFKLYSHKIRAIFDVARVKRWSFDDEILYLAKKNGLKIKEVPVAWVNNFDSKVRPADYLATLFDLFRVKLNYLRGRYKMRNEE